MINKDYYNTDYYKVLGVTKSSDDKAIKKAYRILAKKYHPDKNKDSASSDTFKAISDAYSVLSDSKKKKEYDMVQSTLYRSSAYAGFRDVYSYDDFFKQKAKPKPKNKFDRGTDLKGTITISLKDILNGYTNKIKITRLNKCTKCLGHGTIDHKYQFCSNCNGSGYNRGANLFSTGFDSINSLKKCDVCKGKGKVPSNPCYHCSGIGAIESYSMIPIVIGKGYNKDHILIKGQGNYIKNGISGDLHLNLNFKESSIFERKGADIYHNLKIGLLDSLLGSKIKVPTLHGDVNIKIDKGTLSGKILRLSGKGLPYYGNVKLGSQYLVIEIEIPDTITDEEVKILTSLKGDKWLKGMR